MTNTEFANKIRGVLNTVKACDYAVYLREISKTGAGKILGINDTVTNTDTEILPRPAMTFLSFEEVQGSAGLFQIGDRKFIISNTQTTTDLSSKHIVYNNQVFRVLKYESPMFDSGVVCHIVYARAM